MLAVSLLQRDTASQQYIALTSDVVSLCLALGSRFLSCAKQSALEVTLAMVLKLERAGEEGCLFATPLWS